MRMIDHIIATIMRCPSIEARDVHRALERDDLKHKLLVCLGIEKRRLKDCDAGLLLGDFHYLAAHRATSHEYERVLDELLHRLEPEPEEEVMIIIVKEASDGTRTDS